jgi:hypothetical protein
MSRRRFDKVGNFSARDQELPAWARRAAPRLALSPRQTV